RSLSPGHGDQAEFIALRIGRHDPPLPAGARVLLVLARAESGEPSYLISQRPGVQADVHAVLDIFGSSKSRCPRTPQKAGSMPGTGLSSAPSQNRFRRSPPLLVIP